MGHPITKRPGFGRAGNGHRVAIAGTHRGPRSRRAAHRRVVRRVCAADRGIDRALDHGRARVPRDRRRRRDECRGRRRVEAVPRKRDRALVLRRRRGNWPHSDGRSMTAASVKAASSRATAQRTRLPLRTELAMLLRMFAIQGSWNYETLIGNGIGFCLEPALRLLPGGVHTPRFKEALARQSRYFNAHPYLASIAVGALARAELDGEPADKIERFRTALAGPLGSVGDRLIWAGWMPFCSLLGLAVFGLGGSPVAVL